MSANPTGPLTIGNARGAFVGDLLCRVLEAGGQRVTREYYFNDSGGQVDKLGASVVAMRRGEPVPEDGYHGDYVAELAAAVPDDVWAEADGAGRRRRRDRRGAGRPSGSGRGSRRASSASASTSTSGRARRSLHDEGWVERAIERLRAGGHVYEQDGALWFRSTAFGDDKDRVIIRSNGEPTYFAADIGYVTEKFSRGFDHLIYIWGADHHGTVARVRNAAEAMGYDRDAVQMLLYAWVRFVRDGVEVSMSQAGRRVHHARRAAGRGRRRRRPLVLRLTRRDDRDRLRHRAGQEAVEREPRLLRPVRPRPDRLDPAQGGRGRPGAGRRRRRAAGRRRPRPALARAIARFPEVVEDAVAAEETQGITAYATELATDVPRLLPRRAGRRPGRARAVGGAARARAAATQITLANALGLLGISAPESM